MNRTEWNGNRIVWRAGKHELFEKRCVLFSKLPESQQQHIQSREAFAGKPILVFYKNEDFWTLLTTEEIITSHSEGFFKGKIDEIQKDIDLYYEGEFTNETKLTANYLVLKKLGFKVWAPEGFELFGLWNILLMFPLN